jgi:hypothetical protein
LYALRPCTIDRPWHLVWYYDESTPGDGLRLDQKRKVMCVYVAIREMGNEFLKHTFAWIPVAFLRTTVLKNVSSGFSQAASEMLRHALCDAGNVRDGMYATSIATVLYFKLGNMLSDSEGHKKVWPHKGDAGTFPALELNNVCGVGLKDISEDSGYVVNLACADMSKYHRLTDTEVFEKCDMLEHAHTHGRPPTEIERTEKLFGLTYEPLGLLWQRDLREYVLPVTTNTHDAAHILFAKGVVSFEFVLLAAELRKHAVQFADLRDYFQADWRFPSGCSRRPFHDLFNSSRESSFQKSKFKTMKHFASEMYALVHPMCYMLESSRRLVACMPLAINSWRALADVVRWVRRAKVGDPCADRLQAAVARHDEAYALAYGARAKHTPKSLKLRLLADQVRRDGMIIDTFTGERKHQDSKKCAHQLRNTKHFERDVLLRALARQSQLMNDACFRDSLIGEVIDYDGYKLAAKMLWGGTLYGIDDVVLQHGRAFIILAVYRTGASFGFLVRELYFVREV